ncbi:Ig-like domain-containing protein [Paenibacillus sp. 32352]|uniref:Ig-like domain-containing protein n=1 Tax=Paenibacillus sp. 32352 TaxID=1969111 RepID=UPI0009ABC8DB|nr:Ig-like domain-containing protein [Paenibacillus sp. 32352]
MKGLFNKRLLRLIVSFLWMLQLGALAVVPMAFANTLPIDWSASTMNGSVSPTSTAYVSQESVTYGQGIFDMAARRGKMQSTVSGGDTVYFVYTPVEGDFTITARVVSVGIEPGSSAMNAENRAMLMVKDGVSNDSNSFSVIYKPTTLSPAVTGTVTSYKRFGSSSGAGSSVSGSFNTPIYLKLEKSGNVYKGSYSSDGLNYTTYYSQTDTANTMNSTSLYVGLAVTAATVQFDNVSIIKTSSSALNAPVNLLAQPGDGKVELSWDTVTGATYYNVKRASQSGGPYTTVSGNVYASSYTDAGVVNGINYHYVVTAANEKAESLPSVEVTAKPAAAAIPVSSITVRSTNGEATITAPGGTLQMQAVVLPNNAANRSVSWSVYESDGITITDRATISSTGLLQGMINGKVKVIAKALDGSHVQGSAVVTIAIAGADTTLLQNTVEAAQTLYNAAEEGSNPGQYPIGAKEALLLEINRAKSVVANALATQEQMNEAVDRLNKAIQTFRATVIQFHAGDVDGNGIVNVGDLGIVGGAYERSSSSPGWEAVQHADVNQDGNIDLDDIIYLVHIIP